jgi:hypothetical protein
MKNRLTPDGFFRLFFKEQKKRVVLNIISFYALECNDPISSGSRDVFFCPK